MKLIAHNGSVQRIDLPQDLKDLYKTVWEIKQRRVLDMAADRGAYIDQSQSLNLDLYLQFHSLYLCAVSEDFSQVENCHCELRLSKTSAVVKLSQHVHQVISSNDIIQYFFSGGYPWCSEEHPHGRCQHCEVVVHALSRMGTWSENGSLLPANEGSSRCHQVHSGCGHLEENRF